MKVGDLVRVKEDPKTRPGQTKCVGFIIEVLANKGEFPSRPNLAYFLIKTFHPTTGERVAWSYDIEVINEGR